MNASNIAHVFEMNIERSSYSLMRLMMRENEAIGSNNNCTYVAEAGAEGGESTLMASRVRGPHSRRGPPKG